MASIWETALDQIYESPIGVAAVLTLDNTAADSCDLTVIDKTAGIKVGLPGDAEVYSIIPSACVRRAELIENSVDPEELEGATLVFNGATWTIMNHTPKPSPEGELKGEVVLSLSEVS